MTSAQALPAHTGMSPRSRRLLWAVTIVVAFVIGYLLGRRTCRHNLSSGDTADSQIIGHGNGAGSSGTPMKLGKGHGTGDGGGGHTRGADSGVDTAGGNAAAANGDGGGDVGNGGGHGGSEPDSGVFRKVPKQTDSLFGKFVAGLLKDHQSEHAPVGDPPPATPPAVTRVAQDYSLDGTGLPRYPNSSSVLSGLSTRPDVPADSATACFIDTDDSYATVVSWYNEHMPADWHRMETGQLQRIAQQFTPQNIGKMFKAAISSDTMPSVDTTASADDSVSAAMWAAPDDTPRGKRGVIVTARRGQPTEIRLSRSVTP
jgi:hypothetical protein